MPVRPCVWLECLFPVMAMAMTCSTQPIVRWAGSGICIASLSRPGLVFFCSGWSCSMYRTRLGCRPRPGPAEKEPWGPSSSKESPSWMCRGSSSPASCSARSPVSPKKEKSEPAESEEWRDPGFSLVDCSNEAECSSDRRGGGIRVRRGILAGLKRVEEGMVPVVRG